MTIFFPLLFNHNFNVPLPALCYYKMKSNMIFISEINEFLLGVHSKELMFCLIQINMYCYLNICFNIEL